MEGKLRIIRIAVADITPCRGREFGIFSPDRKCLADSLSYHCRGIAMYWIAHADCRVKGCVKLFQFRYLGQLLVFVPPIICMGGSWLRSNWGRQQCPREKHTEQRRHFPECRFHVHLPL